MAVLVAACLACPAVAAERITLQPADMEDDAFAGAQAGGAMVAPGAGQIGLVGRVGGARFAASDIRHVKLTGPDGQALPLTIEKDSLFIEFGRIVGMRFCCMAGEALVTKGAAFVLSWGDDVEADNQQTDRIVLDPAARGRFRQLAAASAGAGGSEVATIVVIADSYAGWHFLWYLLPLACILVLLVVRKFRIGNRTDPTRS